MAILVQMVYETREITWTTVGPMNAGLVQLVHVVHCFFQTSKNSVGSKNLLYSKRKLKI